MPYRGLMLDFYGTLVAEDDAAAESVVRRIAAASARGAGEDAVRARWVERFYVACAGAHGERFRSQREIEVASLAGVVADFDASLDPGALAEELFAHWVAPAPLPGAVEFLSAFRGRLCIVSNIDEADLRASLRALGWEFEHVVTSEACRAYKPRPEMFRAALAALGCAPGEVLHAGDSLRSDVSGARALGVDAAWIDAQERSLPAGAAARPTHTLRGVRELLPLFG